MCPTPRSSIYLLSSNAEPPTRNAAQRRSQRNAMRVRGGGMTFHSALFQATITRSALPALKSRYQDPALHSLRSWDLCALACTRYVSAVSAGSYQDVAQQTTCVSCPASFHGSVPGAMSMHKCVCGPGHTTILVLYNLSMSFKDKPSLSSVGPLRVPSFFNLSRKPPAPPITFPPTCPASIFLSLPTGQWRLPTWSIRPPCCQGFFLRC